MAAVPATEFPPLWRNRDYILLWLGQTISVVGTQVSQLAFPLLVLALTQSPAQAGFVAAARSVPWLVFALPAGALVDRWDRKRTMLLCSAGSALALGSIVAAYALGALTITQIVAVSFIEGTLSLVFGLAETSALPQVVSRAQLPTAVAQQQAQYAVGSLVLPATFHSWLIAAPTPSPPARYPSFTPASVAKSRSRAAHCARKSGRA